VKRDNGVATVVLAAGQADIADNADEAAAGNESAKAMRPNFIQLGQKGIVIFDVTHLSSGVAVLL